MRVRTHLSNEQRAQRRNMVGMLDMLGMTFSEMQKALEPRFGKVSTSSIHRDRERFNKDFAEMYRNMGSMYIRQLRRYETLIRAYWQGAQSDPKSAMVVLEVMKRLESLTGISAPKRVSVGQDPRAAPIQVEAREAPTQTIDMKRLSLDQLRTLREIRDTVDVQ